MRGYVLAGGRSSRMGVDKAGLRIGGRTLLDLAVEKLRRVSAAVVVVGMRVDAPAGVRVIADQVAECGPAGGIEAALRDLAAVQDEVDDDQDGAEWAAFLPVDMPLLPGGLFEELVRIWLGRDPAPAVAMVRADGAMQPLVSLVHRSVLPHVQRAVAAGEFKVRPMLEGAAAELPTSDAGEPWGVERTELQVDTLQGGFGEWYPTPAEWDLRQQWFGNLNTREEFRAAQERLGVIWDGMR